MLLKVLELLASGRISSVQQLAEQLGVKASLVSGVLQDLASRGLLEVVEGCERPCEGCGVVGCAIATTRRAYALSEAGRAVLAGSS